MLKLQSNGLYWQAAGRVNGRMIKRGCGSRKSLSRSAAQKRVDGMNAALLGGTAALERSPSLSRWLERYEQRRSGTVAGSTTAIHLRTADLLMEYFDPMIKVDSITRSMAIEWREWLGSSERARPLVDSTVCKHVRAAKVIFDMAADEDIVSSNAFDRLRKTPPPVDPASRRMIQPDEYYSIRMACSPRMQLLVDLLWYSGLRKFEAFELQMEDIDWGRGRFYVRNREGRITTKRSSRTVRNGAGTRSTALCPDIWQVGR